jgi:M6 family metalloprotease-like protein
MYTKSRLILLVLLIFCLSSLTACKKEARPAPSPVPVDMSKLDPKLGLHTTDAVGNKKYVVILADFPDVERQYSVDLVTERLLGFVSTYFYEASYHKIDLEGSVTKRYMLPNPVGYYKIKPANLEVDPRKVLSLVTDVVNAADEDVEFSEDLYVIISLGATQVEYGMIGYSAVPGMLGFMSETPITTKSGETVSKAVVFCENAHLGTYIHDTLHMLGGVVDGRRMTPCLYDHDLQAKNTDISDWGNALINMGYWDPLSSHIPYKKELPPTGLSSWTKLRLDWIDPAKIALVQPGETATIKLDPLVNDDASTLVIKIPLTDNTYYLIENRQPIESDANLPSSGVLILHADDSVLECRHGEAPVKIMDANPSVPYLNDAAFDIGKNDTYIDTKNNIAIVLLQKDGSSYMIQITTPDQVK